MIFKREISLKKAIITEYIMIVLFILLAYFFADNLMEVLIGENDGIDSIGQVIVAGFLVHTLEIVLVVLLLIINPIVILVRQKNVLKSFENRVKRIVFTIIIILPILLGLRIAFNGVIEDWKYDHKYNKSKYDYTVEPENYKSASEFREELESRGFLYHEEDKEMLDIMNDNPDHFYIPAVLCRNSDFETFYPPVLEFNSAIQGYVLPPEVINFNTSNKYPYYVYRASIILPHNSSDLVYAPVFNGEGNNSNLGGQDIPYFNDYYIDCEFMYVDGDLYAIIGLYDARSVYNDNFSDEKSKSWMYPYCMILSEKDTITTYVNEMYHGQGAITKSYGTCKMQVNTNISPYSYEFAYEIRTVERLDVDTVNAIARELQEGVLKESIKKYR